MITPESPDKDVSEICVPADALAIDGTVPGQGDEVEFRCKGRVTRAEGGELYVTPTEVNGQPVANPADEAKEPTGDDIMAMARKMDEGM